MVAYAVGMTSTQPDPARGPKSERTRARLIDVAIERFGDVGFRAASVSAIARVAGLTPAAAYAYFADKQALFDAAVRADFDRMMAEALPGASPDLTVAARPMASLFANLLAAIPRHPLVSEVIKRGTPSELQTLLQADAIRRLTDELERGIRARQQSGHAAHLDARSLAFGTETIVMSLLTVVVRAELPLDRERAMGVIAVFDAAFGGAPDAAEIERARRAAAGD